MKKKMHVSGRFAKKYGKDGALKKYLLSFFVLCLCSALAGAQQMTDVPADTLKWTLQDCLNYARQNNIQIQTLQKNVDLSQQDLLQARALMYPNLSASASQNFVHSETPDAGGGKGYHGQADLSGSYGVSSSVTLYQGGSLRNNVQSQKLFIRAADLDVAQALNDLTIQITQAYLNILLSNESITALQNVVQTSQAQYDHGKILFDAGSIAKNALVQLEAGLATDQYNLVLAQSLLRQNILTLKQILELPSGYNFQILQQTNLNIPSSVSDLKTVQDSALNNRPEVKIGENAIQQADIQLKQAYTTKLPTISAGAGLSTANGTIQQGNYFNQVNHNFLQQVGISVGIPIFNNRTTRTNIEKSKIAIDQSDLALKSTKLVLSQEVEQAYINFQNAKAQYDAAQVQFAANEENYRIANEQLDLGAIAMVDFLVQKDQFIQAQQALIQAKYSVILNHGIYEFYMGQPITL